MSYIIHVYLKNADFSEEYAHEKHEGKESLENVRYEWEDEFAIRGDIDDIEVVRYTDYTLTGEQGEGTPFSILFNDVLLFHFKIGDTITPIAISEAALDEYVLDTDRKKLFIYLNDDEVIENPIPGIYLRGSEFPKELRG